MVVWVLVVVQLAHSAFLSTINVTFDLAEHLFSSSVHSVPYVKVLGSFFDRLATETLPSTFVNTSFFFSVGMSHTLWSRLFVADHLLERTDERFNGRLFAKCP